MKIFCRTKPPRYPFISFPFLIFNLWTDHFLKENIDFQKHSTRIPFFKRYPPQIFNANKITTRVLCILNCSFTNIQSFILYYLCIHAAQGRDGNTLLDKFWNACYIRLTNRGSLKFMQGKLLKISGSFKLNILYGKGKHA